ncbi:hypothetical protein C1645_773831 [Glomus cerebriforme]|uniref:RBR-type E3 ubiquitin transferase n=1 Tax=Glomus cerebriforme TaxID=658196 RepID=A0A397SRV9_9GLOM|nr:hypothetical protein C1645_773831 [Glomus cerebriforme]
MRRGRERRSRIGSICSICCDVTTKFPSSITSKCNHEMLVCNSCVEKHVSANIEKGNFQDIKCLQCIEILDYHDIKRIVNDELFQRYDVLLLRQTLSKMKDFRWCKRPNCGWGQIHNGGDDAPIITCKACGAKSCFTHDVPWHEDSSCSEFAKKLSKDTEANQAYYDSHTKRCPKCEMPIEKNDGCEHMTCLCHYEFCWLCLADYDMIRKNGNEHHERTCQHHQDNLNTTEPFDDIIVPPSSISSNYETIERVRARMIYR